MTTTTSRIFNFSAGPAVMPESVLERIQGDVWNIDDSGIGVLEHSHRGPVIDRVFEEATDRCRSLAGLGDDHEVLFLAGGASMQFGMIPMNYLPDGGHRRLPGHRKPGRRKAIKEARRSSAMVNVAFAGADCSYDHCPKSKEELSLTPGRRLPPLLLQQHDLRHPLRRLRRSSGAPLVCDASSEMFSRPWPFADHAHWSTQGAQKNLGPIRRRPGDHPQGHAR